MKLYKHTSGEGPDIVLIHGWGMNCAVWQSIEPHLSKQHRVTQIELPGHGASEYDPQKSALSDWVEACLSVVPTRAIWIGWSLGGQLAIQAAHDAPERVSRLVLIATSPKFTCEEDWQTAIPRETIKSFTRELTTNCRQTLERFLFLQAQGGDQTRQVLRTLRQAHHIRPENNLAALAQGLTFLLNADLRHALTELCCQMLWMLGEQDKLVPITLAHQLPALCQQLQTVVLKDAAHAPFISHQREILKAIEDFVGETYG